VSYYSAVNTKPTLCSYPVERSGTNWESR